ncbi:histamine N-methyltransferase-like [Oculina patagonica]
MPLVPLWESHDIYERSHQAFVDNSTLRQPAMLNFTQEGIRQALLKIIENIDINEPLKVLGIGSGSGEIDLLILQNMAEYLISQKKKRPTIQNVIVEPNARLLEQFKMKASVLPPLLENEANVSFEWHQKPFQEFNQETIIDEKGFDLIHFVHSIYFLDVDDALRSCFEQRLKKENGAIICFVQTEESYFAKVSKTFKGSLSCGSEVMSYYTDQDLTAIAEKYGWKYCVPVRKQFQINVTACLHEPTSEVDPLIDFLTQQQNFRANAERELFNSVMEMIDSLAFTNDSGEKFVKAENTAVIIYK